MSDRSLAKWIVTLRRKYFVANTDAVLIYAYDEVQIIFGEITIKIKFS